MLYPTPCLTSLPLPIPRPPRPTLFPYTTLFRSHPPAAWQLAAGHLGGGRLLVHQPRRRRPRGDRKRAGHAGAGAGQDRKSTRLNSSHVKISYAVFCLKKKKKKSPQVRLINAFHK